jgi:hypothetical protein
MKTGRECVLSELDCLADVSGNLKGSSHKPPFRTRRQERRCFITACVDDQYLRRLAASDRLPIVTPTPRRRRSRVRRRRRKYVSSSFWLRFRGIWWQKGVTSLGRSRKVADPRLAAKVPCADLTLRQKGTSPC